MSSHAHKEDNFYHNHKIETCMFVPNSLVWHYLIFLGCWYHCVQVYEGILRRYGHSIYKLYCSLQHWNALNTRITKGLFSTMSHLMRQCHNQHRFWRCNIVFIINVHLLVRELFQLAQLFMVSIRYTKPPPIWPLRP